MDIVVTTSGDVRCIYQEAIELAAIGSVDISRGSHVEPAGSIWFADLVPVNGPRLGPFIKRSEALAAEIEWLETHWIADVNRNTISPELLSNRDS